MYVCMYVYVLRRPHNLFTLLSLRLYVCVFDTTVEAYNSTWTKLPYEQVTLRGVQKFLKVCHVELNVFI